MKKIQVSVGSVAQALDRFEHAWRQAEKGGARTAQVRLTFESLPTLLKNYGLEPSVIGLLAGALARTPVRVMTRHYSDYHTRIDKHWHVQLDRLCTRLSTAVIAVSRHTAEHMITKSSEATVAAV